MTAGWIAAAPVPIEDPRVIACGPRSSEGWLCGQTFRVTNSRYAAEIADTLSKPIHILLILFLAFLAVRVARLILKRTVRRLQRLETSDRLSTLRRRSGLGLLDTHETPTVRRVQRSETIAGALRSVISFVVWVVAAILILEDLGVRLGPLLAGAGLIGVALGFGAQTLVRDFLAGTFIVIEEWYAVGDVIDVGEVVGVVEFMSLRATTIRDVKGVVWHFPNGEIKRAGNKSQQWSRALLDVAVARNTDVPNAERVMRETGSAMFHDPQYQNAILGEPEVWGVEDLGADRMLIRIAVKTAPGEQDAVARELRARLKAAFDEADIEIPLPAQTITYRSAGGAPPFSGGAQAEGGGAAGGNGPPTDAR
ncbi:MAG: mechanosensitive ion channel family protein [Actinomycetia bacterium]|nr:mechanosensitive ion channel family protein [Actinomycetes bacterium]